MLGAPQTVLVRGDDVSGFCRRSNRFEEELIRWVALYSTVMVALLVGQVTIETMAFKCAGDLVCRERYSWPGWTAQLATSC